MSSDRAGDNRDPNRGMRIRYACRSCEKTVATRGLELPAELLCPGCGDKAMFAAPASPAEHLDRCPGCAGQHMFVQKEFPRRVGLAIAAAGAILFLILMGFERIYLGFGVLFAVALLDTLIYRAAPLMTVCYHCASEFRRAPTNPKHSAYDPKIAFYTAKKQDRGRIPDGG